VRCPVGRVKSVRVLVSLMAAAISSFERQASADPNTDGSARAAARAAATERRSNTAIVVTASRTDLLGVATTASQGGVTGQELRLRPSYRIAQLLESVPGLVVTVHSGEGKAYQYLLRGFNLDHGTDIANFIDDMPINRPTNAHGQGYSDQNFVIPELIGGLDYTKGPYFPQVGDFGDVASLRLKLSDLVPNQVAISAGTLNDDRALATGTRVFGSGDRLTGALDYGHVDGPFIHPDNFQKYAAALRYAHGTQANGYDLTALYYHGQGRFTTDQPQRAIDAGLIGRYGSLDPSDGTSNERVSLSGHFDAAAGPWRLNTNSYVVHSRQTLFNDFTHFLEDPINGDQEEQDETRDLVGGAASVSLDAAIGSVESQTTAGFQLRYDSVFVDRRHTRQRHVLDYCEQAQLSGPAVAYAIGQSACAADRVALTDQGFYVENATRLTGWLRADLGLRDEVYQGRDHSLTTGFRGAKTAELLQPKASLILGPWAQSELYVSAGRGFHSDDIRGVLQTVPIEGLPTRVGPTPLLVAATGEEIGLRSDLIPKLHVQVSVFQIDLQSELVYDQDQGQDQASAPSERQGVEASAQYRPVHWLELNSDLSFSRARFTAHNLAAYGFVGPYIPNAPSFVGSFGALVDGFGPWFGGLELRILGPYPLISDNSQRDPGYAETNVSVGRHLSRRLSTEFEVFNLFDEKANSAAYYYVSRLPGEAPAGVADHQIHPLEPISARWSLTATF